MSIISEELKRGTVLSVIDPALRDIRDGRTGGARCYAYVACPNEKENLIFIRITAADGSLLKHAGKEVVCLRVPLAIDQYDSCSYGDHDGDVEFCSSDSRQTGYISICAHQYDGLDLSFAIRQIVADLVMELTEE